MPNKSGKLTSFNRQTHGQRKRILVCGAGGFIGSHMVKRLAALGHEVTGVDLKKPEFSPSAADHFVVGDLRDQALVRDLFRFKYDEIYQFAADMGGAGYIFTGLNDAGIMHNSAQINLNILDFVVKTQDVKRIKVFFSSSACIYPEHNQLDPNNPICTEDSAYPAHPDSEYGWEKIFSERIYLAFRRNLGLQTYVARFHNIFGEEGTWTGGKEKAPAAVCRKVAEAQDGGSIELWGDGQQTRSFLYIDECIDGVIRLVESDFAGPVNIGSEEMIAIGDLAKMVIKLSGKNLNIKYIPGPTGVRGRNSDNRLILEKLNWTPSQPLEVGMAKLYAWVNELVAKQHHKAAS